MHMTYPTRTNMDSLEVSLPMFRSMTFLLAEFNLNRYEHIWFLFDRWPVPSPHPFRPFVHFCGWAVDVMHIRIPIPIPFYINLHFCCDLDVQQTSQQHLTWFWFETSEVLENGSIHLQTGHVVPNFVVSELITFDHRNLVWQVVIIQHWCRMT